MHKQFTETLCGRSNIELNSKVAEEYPWFTLGVALLARDLTFSGDGQRAALLKKSNSISFSINSYRKIMGGFSATKAERVTIDAIDSFLSKGSHKISMPTKETPTKRINVGSEALKEDIVTEQYANILYSQGHKERAIAIYNKLSLKYPKKSVYFANQLATLTENK